MANLSATKVEVSPLNAPVSPRRLLQEESHCSGPPFPVRSMPQQSSGRGRGHWDQEEVRRRATSPSDFPWGRGNVNPVPSGGGVSGRLPLSRISSTEGQPRRQPSPALAGRDPSGAIQQGPEKYPVRKGGVKTWREGRQSKSGPRGRTTKFHQFGQDGPGQPSPSSSLTGAFQQSHSSSPSGPPPLW